VYRKLLSRIFYCPKIILRNGREKKRDFDKRGNLAASNLTGPFTSNHANKISWRKALFLYCCTHCS